MPVGVFPRGCCIPPPPDSGSRYFCIRGGSRLRNTPCGMVQKIGNCLFLLICGGWFTVSKQLSQTPHGPSQRNAKTHRILAESCILRGSDKRLTIRRSRPTWLRPSATIPKHKATAYWKISIHASSILGLFIIINRNLLLALVIF